MRHALATLALLAATITPAHSAQLPGVVGGEDVGPPTRGGETGAPPTHVTVVQVRAQVGGDTAYPPCCLPRVLPALLIEDGAETTGGYLVLPALPHEHELLLGALGHRWSYFAQHTGEYDQLWRGVPSPVPPTAAPDVPTPVPGLPPFLRMPMPPPSPPLALTPPAPPSIYGPEPMPAGYYPWGDGRCSDYNGNPYCPSTWSCPLCVEEAGINDAATKAEAMRAMHVPTPVPGPAPHQEPPELDEDPLPPV